MGVQPQGDAQPLHDRQQPQLASALDAVAMDDVPVGDVKPERRQASVRRDLNDLVRGPDGKVAEAKVFVLVFKAAMVWAFVEHIAAILKDWMILGLFIAALIAPDLFKKMMVMRLGGNPTNSKDATK